ncbi:MAG: hypothetical protein EOO43_02435 [Flavobacterium sp.]|nr:MAG: hypothetical protein EOO43_02435 [Flavobacterium sp.]
MNHFTLFPDYEKLSKYYQISLTPEEITVANEIGLNVEVNIYHSEEVIATIAKGFKEIIEKYNLMHHHDSLMYLALSKVDEIDSILYEISFAYHQKMRTKELAEFLLTFNASSMYKRNAILLKTQNSTAKLADSQLINVVGNMIIQGLEKGQYPISVLEFDLQDRFFDDTGKGLELSPQKLQIEASRTVHSPKTYINSQLFDFCFYLYPYLINETDIKENSDVIVSDDQLNLYFDLLVLFQFIYPDHIHSAPKDYMRTLLRNKLNKLKTSSTGK